MAKKQVMSPEGRQLAVEIGERIRKHRKMLDITQSEIARRLRERGFKMSGHSGVSHWERAENLMGFDVAVELARILEVTPEYLVYGVRDEEQTARGVEIVDEVDWSETIEGAAPLSKWGLPGEVARSASCRGDASDLKIVAHESNAFAPSLKAGDWLLVDTGSRRVMRPGYYMLWNGVSGQVAQLTPLPHKAGRARLAYGREASEGVEVRTDALHVLGRIVKRFGSVV